MLQHIIDSVPPCDYGLSFQQLKSKQIRHLKKIGVIGGILIFHAERYNNLEESLRKHQPFGWYTAFHWHIVGFIQDGYLSVVSVLI